MGSEPYGRKIEETVVEILKTTDLETVNEYNLRLMLADRLNLDLTLVEQKLLVRRAVESYLLSLPDEQKLLEQTKEVVQQQPNPNSELNRCNSLGSRDNSCRTICKLSNRRTVSVKHLGGKTLVGLIDSFQKDGQQFNSTRGITLTTSQWSVLKHNIPTIEDAIVKMNSRKRKLEAVKKPSETDTCNKVCVLDSQGEISIGRKQSEAVNSNVPISSATEEYISPLPQQTHVDPPGLMANGDPDGHVKQNLFSSIPPQGLIPIETSRLNGRNYSCWMRQMYFFLNQLKISYVLTEPCPDVRLHEEASSEKTAQAKVAARKWADDDYLCRTSILNSLSDHLFDQYSKRMCSSKELWEELKLSFDEDFGTKRSQVNKYMQYQMVDGVSVLGQVQELHEIADSIIASGMWIDENFHVSAIVSKLPPSWKECRVKLMKEEFLPLSKLMYILKVEENTRNRHKVFGSSKNSKFENKIGSKPMEAKRLCYMCGKEGHISKNCGLRKLVETNKDKDNGDVPQTSEGKALEKKI